MQRNRAMRWFGLLLFGSAVVAAAVLGLPWVQSAMTHAAPEPQPRIGAPERPAQAEPQLVTIEPSSIEVIGRRSAVQVGAREASSRRRPG